MGLFALALALLVFGGLLFGYVGIASALPSPEDLQARASQFASTQIFDRQGQLLNEIADPAHGRRTVVTLDQISRHLHRCHHSHRRPELLPAPRRRSGGPGARRLLCSAAIGTSAGQVAAPSPNSWSSWSTCRPNARRRARSKRPFWPPKSHAVIRKKTVLQIYLNEIYYGNLAYGIEAASETYFGKHAKDLDLAEASMLAGLPQAPAYYDPYTKLWEPDGQPGLGQETPGRWCWA